MKRFKIGLAALVAILAMSFTVVTRNNAKLSKLALSEGCFKSISTSATLPGTSNPGHQIDASFSPVVLDAADTEIDLVSANSEIESNCPADFEVFCCYRVQFLDGEYKVTGVAYKDAQQ